ncbi:MAG: ABC transporter ATP-binding protein [Pirellulaceae bacterium]|jgi:ABC-2 type transport system ATP-binding protein|nr:ABC transporter ATP-binding protein [Pirellulaceae bacterium]MDP7018793.1 ABC transporter ATP-binding protein [Pirellulaceae bacterium]
MTAAIEVDRVSHRYGTREALKQVSLDVQRGEVYAVLGPNGGGKTTLFRLISTLIPIQEGGVSILGADVRTDPVAAQMRMGVVFQAPSLDHKLTVRENIRHQATLYGLSRRVTAEREAELVEQLGVADRVDDLVETLSGGLRRRVELAKGMIHRPQVLLLDEPSTGLDPGARADLWSYLGRVRSESNVTVALTTHLLEEAERADRIAILNEGVVVDIDSPDALRASVGGDTITVVADDPEKLNRAIGERLGVAAQVVDGTVRLEQPDGHQWITRIVEAFPEEIKTITLAKPTLEDVFIAKTGHRFWLDTEAGD